MRTLPGEISNAVGFKDDNLREQNGFYVKRSDFIWGRQLKYGESGNIWLLRLGKKELGDWKGMTHEKWIIDEPIGKLTNSLLHFPHKKLEEFLREINFYTDIRASELNEKNVKSSAWAIIFFPFGKFIVNYVFKRGLLDGIPGLVFAITMSFHSFLVRGKLWLKKS